MTASTTSTPSRLRTAPLSAAEPGSSTNTAGTATSNTASHAAPASAAGGSASAGAAVASRTRPMPNRPAPPAAPPPVLSAVSGGSPALGAEAASTPPDSQAADRSPQALHAPVLPGPGRTGPGSDERLDFSPESQSSGTAGTTGTPPGRQPGARSGPGRTTTSAPGRAGISPRRSPKGHGQAQASAATAQGAEQGVAQEPPIPPNAARSAAIIVVAAAEVLAGQRPVDHLTRWTTPPMFEAIARRAGLAARILGTGRRSHRPRMRSVHTQVTASGACEATILLEDSGRVRAAAARLVPQRGRWVLAGLEMA